LQAATTKAIRPLARSGLFDNPLLKPVLDSIGAVPIYRRGDPGVDVSSNRDTFKRCYELLAKGETLIIFPEGQSHDVPRLERFFAFRHGKYRQCNLQQRLRAQQRLIDAKQLLRKYEPDRVRALISQLKQFEKICRYCGVKDYQLTIEYKPTLIVLYLLRMVWMSLVVFPVVAWGIINSYIPYKLTNHLTHYFAKGTNQSDTTKIILGLVFFATFWLLQSYLVFHYLGLLWMSGYIFTLALSSVVTLTVRGELRRIRENVRVFLLFLRRRELKTYLRQKRQELEQELAHMVRIAKRLS
jgi:1-acyl-sn-glycerol-3-phosphate acyltransferase